MEREQAVMKAREFLNVIFGEGDARLGPKSDELADMLLDARTDGFVQGRQQAAAKPQRRPAAKKRAPAKVTPAKKARKAKRGRR